MTGCDKETQANPDKSWRLFEYPLKENIRGFLRLESLFGLLSQLRVSDSSNGHLHALRVLFEILEILERGDTRSELIKELTRLREYFDSLFINPEVDSSKLETFLDQLTQLQSWTLNYQGKFGERLRRTPFLESIRYRLSIPGGSCAFDCPDLYLFMQQGAKQREAQFATWFADIKGIATSIEVILKIIRDGGQWQEREAPLGNFILETSAQPFQLLRLKATSSEEIFPEFSSGKHRTSIHFMTFNRLHKKIPVQQPVSFYLSCCS